MDFLKINIMPYFNALNSSFVFEISRSRRFVFKILQWKLFHWTRLLKMRLKDLKLSIF